MSEWERELEVAIAASKRAAQLALSMQAGIVFESKPDGSPVTAADKACESILTKMINEAFPDDGLLGEEGASVESRNGRRWIIDPIDGTRDYVRGTPLWANLIGLEANGEIVAGVVNLPMLGGIYSASRGHGAFHDRERLRASEKTSFSESLLCVNGLNRIREIPFREELLKRLPDFWAVRTLGGAPDAMLVASGHADAWIEPKAAPWDLAALKIVIEEAGGRFFNFDGRSTIDGGNCVACAPGLEGEMRKLLGIA
jgi:histidinol-phosphatase